MIYYLHFIKKIAEKLPIIYNGTERIFVYALVPALLLLLPYLSTWQLLVSKSEKYQPFENRF